METEFLNVNEAASFLRVSPWTVRWWLTAGRLPRFKAGGRTLISRKSILEFVTQETAETATARNAKRAAKRAAKENAR